MNTHLLICTDLDRTLIPNGLLPESPAAREHFATLAAHSGVTLAYVSGRHRALVEQAIEDYCLPCPDFVIADVGTTIYHVGHENDWLRQDDWAQTLAADWGGRSHEQLAALLADVEALRPQEPERQNEHKLSYYTAPYGDREILATRIHARFAAPRILANLIWSVDEPAGVGLLDVLPPSASKFHAIEYLMRRQGFSAGECVFCGDSGNDIEVLASPIPAVLVANCEPSVRELALSLAADRGLREQLYIARGGFHGMNGNYSAGALEGIAHFLPHTEGWMGFARVGSPT